jgi:hypothetical protein
MRSERTMNDKSKEIKQANTIKDLYKHLEWIMGETERIVGARRVTFEEVQQMADYLKDIRLLLSELDCREVWPDNAGPADQPKKNLAARYLDLEGKVKELRNDLNRKENRENV